MARSVRRWGMRATGARTPFRFRLWRGQEGGATGAGGARAGLCPLGVRPVVVVVAAKCAPHLAVAGRYGWQRDELYYAVAGRHLQGGYVEFPPVTAWLSALARVLFGWSLVGFRAFAILAGAVTIVVAALVARDLGGGRREWAGRAT